MSTCYSTLKSPVTHIAVEKEGERDDEWSRVTLSVNQQLVGVLVVPQADLRDFLELFFNDEDALTVTSTGVHSQMNTEYWRDEVVLLSEYGELTTWGALTEQEKV